MADLKNSPAWQKGRQGELLIRELLKSKGWFIIPSSDYVGHDGHAPILQGLRDNIILPDLDIARNRMRYWAEVKTKTAPTLTRITKRLEHGFSLKQYKHYQRVQIETQTPVWIFVYELNSQRVLYQALDILKQHARIYHGDKMDRGGMIFFPCDAFKEWGLGNLYEQEPFPTKFRQLALPI